jgi:hypothetical protein
MWRLADTEQALAREAIMSKRDFVLLAHFMRSTKGIMDGSNMQPMWRDMCRDLAARLAGTNPKFDRNRFLSACGVAEG